MPPMGVSRLIASLKEMGQWEPHVRAIRVGAAPAQPEDAPAPSSPPLVLPTPRSLRSQLDASATRLGDGRPYLNGATWGLYREAFKMGTAVIAAGGRVTRKKAAAVAALLELVGVTISESTLYEGARSAPGESPARRGRTLTLPPELLAAARKVAVTYP